MKTTCKGKERLPFFSDPSNQPYFIHGVVYRDSKAWVVWHGRQNGIYTEETEFKKQVENFVGANYKYFDNIFDAVSAYRNPYELPTTEKVPIPTPIF